MDHQKQLEIFSNYLKKQGLKITQQRLLVAKHIFTSDNHFTVDSLTDELKSRKDSISRATIYRIVSVMVDAGLLTEHNFGQDTRRYEHIPGHSHHDHIICIDCGWIGEFVDPEIESLQLKIAKKQGFELEDHKMNLYGRCIHLLNGKKCPNKNGK